jgi:hypothetical protein
VKLRLSQYQNDCWPVCSILALVMVFFVLPYIADVPYMDDQAPVNDAEENSKVEGQSGPKYEEVTPLLDDVHIDSVVGHGLTPQDVYSRIAYPTKRPLSSQCLFHASLISRPPPIA